MPNCESCGAGIDTSDRECPYCGASVIEKTTVHQRELERPEKVYTTSTDADGNTQIRFGDGQTGRRLPSGSIVNLVPIDKEWVLGVALVQDS